MDLQQLELHDAELLSVTMDAQRATVEVRLAYYSDSQSRERVVGMLRFSGVSRFNQIVDLDHLRNHARAGNVSYWVTGESPGVSYIYLARGLVEVAATSIEIVTL
jgi:hypothetical protein